MPHDADGAGFTVSDAPTGEEKKERTPQRERIIEAVQNAGVTFWRDADGHGFATVPLEGTLRRYRVRSRTFGLVVRSLYGAFNRVTGRNGSTRPGSVSDSALAEAISAFEAMALT